MKKLFVAVVLTVFIGFLSAPANVSASGIAKTNINKVGKCLNCGKDNCDRSSIAPKDSCKGKDAKCTKKMDGTCDKSKKSGCCKDKDKTNETKK